MKIFKSFKEWGKFLFTSIWCVLLGILKTLWAIIGGIISYCLYVYDSIASYARREFKAAFITGVILVVVGFLFLYVFVNERSHRVMAEYERDSLYLKLENMGQIHQTSEQLQSELDIIE